MTASCKFKHKVIFKTKGFSIFIKYNLDTDCIGIRTIFHLQKQKNNYTWKNSHQEQIKRAEKLRHSHSKALLHRLKINGCAICGYNKCPNALEFHHVNSEDKKFHLVASNLQRTEESLIEEINKCVLLCANCHREIHCRKSGALIE